MLRRKNLKAMIAAGELPLGFIMNLVDPAVAELAALAGYDFIRIDGEHVAYNLESVQSIVRAADSVGLPVIIRTANYENISALLDCGIAGIMAPHVRSAKQAKELVDLVKYSPVGRRGFTNNGRAHRYGCLSFDEYVNQAEQETIVEVQIEDREGIEHMEEIISTPGVDWVCSGRGDISQALGMLGKTRDPQVLAIEDQILKTAKKYKKYGQLTTSSLEEAMDFIAKGVGAITVTSDIMTLLPAAEQLRKGLEAAKERFRVMRKEE